LKTQFYLLPFILPTFVACASSPPAAVSSHSEPGISADDSRSDQADRLFEILDVNSDGSLSRAEAQSGFKYIIAQVDRPSDSTMLAAKPGSGGNSAAKSSRPNRNARKPTSKDAEKAFATLFESGSDTTSRTQASALNREQFKKLVIKSGQDPLADPFVPFLN
jgi:hypothetical protein